MKYQKIRGHRRRKKQIEQWRVDSLTLRTNLLESYNDDYVDIVVHPWCDLSIIKSTIPEPKRKTKPLMLKALIDVYYSWKQQLEKIGQPYYLKIWLREPCFSKSEVVCGINTSIEKYDNLFPEPNHIKLFKSESYGALKTELDKLKWQFRLDETPIDDDYVGKPEDYSNYRDFIETKKWFDRKMKKPHRTLKYSNGTEYHLFECGNLWIGG